MQSNGSRCSIRSREEKPRSQFFFHTRLHGSPGRRNSAENDAMPRNSADNFTGVNNVDSASLNTVEKT